MCCFIKEMPPTAASLSLASSAMFFSHRSFEMDCLGQGSVLRGTQS
jgi:hypothetical protein